LDYCKRSITAGSFLPNGDTPPVPFQTGGDNRYHRRILFKLMVIVGITVNLYYKSAVIGMMGITARLC
jgi:hypothetical protein